MELDQHINSDFFFFGKAFSYRTGSSTFVVVVADGLRKTK